MTDPLRTIAIVSLFIGAASALIIAVDLVAGTTAHVDHELGMADHGALRRAARALGLLYHRPALDLSRGAGSEGARPRTAREKETVLANGRVRYHTLRRRLRPW